MALAQKVNELAELKAIAATLDSVIEGLQLEIEREMSRRAAQAVPAAHSTWMCNCSDVNHSQRREGAA